MPLINISGWVKQKLEAIKEEEEHKSLDSVVRSLILHYEKKEGK